MSELAYHFPMLANTQTEATKACTKCIEEKPLEHFPVIRVKRKDGSVWKGRRGECRACNTRRVKRWQKENPEAVRRHTRRQTLRSSIGRKALKAVTDGVSPERLDALRRALSDSPPELVSETDTLAYFRGFVAGAKRSEKEGVRFERLKDLCHRIAAEKGVFGHLYEERLSAAYEGLLGFIRGRELLSFASLEHERRAAAIRIRGALKDYARASGPMTPAGYQRSPIPEASLGLAEEMTGPSKLVAAPEASQDEPGEDFERILSCVTDERHRAVLTALAHGASLREAGAVIGVSDSMACHIAKRARELYPELEERLLVG